MADLLSTATLANWVQEDPAEVAANPFAVDLISKVSALICFLGGHDATKYTSATPPVLIPEWTLSAGPSLAPIDVQMVALQVIKRSYENPTQIIQEGAVGPLGGERYADTHALFMDFTEAERKTLTKYNVDGDPTPGDGSGEIFVLATTRGYETTLPQVSPLYVGDNMQTGLAESVDPREWKIPLFNPGDPGDDSLYA